MESDLTTQLLHDKDEENYQWSRRGLAAYCQIPDDIAQLYAMANLSIGPKLRTMEDRVALTLAVPQNLKHLLLGTNSLYRHHSVQMYREVRLHPWSRTSILIFSGLLAAGCGMTALMVNIAPLPPPGNGPPEPGGTRIGITIFYGLLALLGGGWLYFFNSAKAKAQFTRPVAGSTSFGGARPLSVTIIGSFLLLSVAMFMILGFCAVPATFFGLLVIGLPGHLLYIGFGGIALWLGIGLLRLNPLARFVAVGYFTFLVLNGLLFFVVLPGYTQRVNTSLAILPSELRPAQVGGYARSMAASMLTSVLINAIPIWFLLTGRDAIYFLLEKREGHIQEVCEFEMRGGLCRNQRYQSPY